MFDFIFGFVTGLFLVLCGTLYYGYRLSKKTDPENNEKKIVITVIDHED